MSVLPPLSSDHSEDDRRALDTRSDAWPHRSRRHRTLIHRSWVQAVTPPRAVDSPVPVIGIVGCETDTTVRRAA